MGERHTHRHQTFNAANQVNGVTYDAAGNLTNDGTATYTYDALGPMIGPRQHDLRL